MSPIKRTAFFQVRHALVQTLDSKHFASLRYHMPASTTAKIRRARSAMIGEQVAFPLPEMSAPSQAPAAELGPKLYVVEPSPLDREFWLLRRAIVAAHEDNCFSIAKGAAYSFLLSLFPILTTLTAILIRARAQSVVHVLSNVIAQIVPPETEELIVSRIREGTARPIGLSITIVFIAIWAGSGAMLSLMEGFQAAYRIPSGRPFLKQRAMAIFLLFTAALPAVGASSLIIFGNRGEAAFIRWLGVSPHDDLAAPIPLLWSFVRYVIAFATTTFVTGLLYYFGPNHRPEQRTVLSATSSRFLRVWPGAVLSTALWLLATTGFAWYVSHFANYNFFYGSLGAVIILLVWLYLIACIALIGCEFNAERERVESLPSLR